MPDQVPVIRVEGMPPEPKQWAHSRVLWFNAFCLAVGAAEAKWNLLEQVLPGNAYAWGAFILAVGNVFLRALTSQAVTLRKDSP